MLSEVDWGLWWNNFRGDMIVGGIVAAGCVAVLGLYWLVTFVWGLFSKDWEAHEWRL